VVFFYFYDHREKKSTGIGKIKSILIKLLGNLIIPHDESDSQSSSKVFTTKSDLKKKSKRT